MGRLSVIDLSHYQTVTDVATIKAAGVLGIIAKATEGANYTDDKFASFRSMFKGFGWASYHFLKPGNIDAQMVHYMTVATPAKGERIVIDYEDAGCALADLQEAMTWLRSNAPDNPICVYGGGLMKGQLGGNTAPWLDGTSLWVAEYNSNPVPSWPTQVWPKWDLWQYSDGSVGGNPRVVLGVSQCDCNEFNGTDAECLAWFGNVGGMPAMVTPILNLGMSGPDVSAMQLQLVKFGAQIATDGVFGPLTERAVVAFQSSHGLVPDGIVGPKTMAVLGS